MSDVEIRRADAIPEADHSEQARLSHRLEAVGQLAAGIAHEINTPLQFVGDSVKFLNEAVEELLTLTGLYRELLWTEVPIGQEQRKQVMTDAEEHADLDYLLERIPAAFNRTMEGLDRVTSIVGAMKSFAHPEGSEAIPTDLNEALETTLTVCRNEYKHVAELQLELGELRLVTCNLGEINQVLLNLIVNAAQAIAESVEGTDRQGTNTITTRLDCTRRSSRSPTTVRASRLRSRIASTTRSSRPKRSAKEQDRDWHWRGPRSSATRAL